jgi:hypothetical protein
VTQRDPRRLLDPGSEAHPNLRALLAAGRAELPDADRVARMAARAAQSFHAPSADSGASALAGSGPPVGPLLACALLLAGAGGALYALVHHAREGAPRTVQLPAASASASVHVPSSPGGTAPAALPAASPAPARGQRASARQASGPGQRSARARAAPAAGDALAELTLLDAAQADLRDAPELALLRANEHARRFPHGDFQQEREVIAIEALLRLGRRAAAERRASAFVVRFPTSGYRGRVEQQRDHARARGVPADSDSK